MFKKIVIAIIVLPVVFIMYRAIMIQHEKSVVRSEINAQCSYDIMSYKLLSVSVDKGIASICVDYKGTRDCCEGIKMTDRIREASFNLQN